MGAAGGRRRRAIGLAIAATANVHRVRLLTADAADLAVIGDLVEVQALD
jgi:predicted nucleic acid-binding protein